MNQDFQNFSFDRRVYEEDLLEFMNYV